MTDNEYEVARTVSLQTSVPTIEAAFAFVITAIDSERLTFPSITITPITYSAFGTDDEPEAEETVYHTSVSGNVARSS